MTFAQRWHDIRTGFERPFWVANISELFERLSYYAAFASLARYLHEVLKFPTEQTGTLAGFFGGLGWFLPVFGGTLADRMGFRRALLQKKTSAPSATRSTTRWSTSAEPPGRSSRRTCIST